MSYLTNASKTQALDAITSTHLSLHTDFPGDSGASEVSGGSPAYARKAYTKAAAAGTPPESNSNGLSVVFDVPAGTAVKWIGGWTALTGGTFKHASPAGGSKKAIATIQAADDTFRSDAHPFVNGDRVVGLPVLGEALPGGLTQGADYFVVGATADTFQLSLTPGGAAINFSSDAEVAFYDMVVATDVQQFKVEVPQSVLSLNG
jgi:hypothetical protein